MAVAEKATASPTDCPFKVDWYQSDTQVVVSVFAKNIDPKTVEFDLTEDAIELRATKDGETFEKKLHLAGKILADKSSHRVAATKVEIRLMKADGSRWSTLERPLEASAVAVKSSVKPRDWDKVVSELPEDEVEGEAKLQELFQRIYSEGSDEVKRAMNKSFMESGGTELNTNWGAVSKGEVSIKPPDGMEWKKWDS